MIPQRVSIKNFLCYQDDGLGGPVLFDFDGSRLWSISGDNGAGKSTIFDAIRYALFAEHRGGKQRHSRVVRKGASSAYVAFEFAVGNRIFRIQRTVSRTEKKTCQASVFDPEEGEWRPIPETDSERGLARWVKETIRLDAQTFCASTMLLQGESDRLIKAGPTDRFDILSGLLDMEVYQRIEREARNRAKWHRDEVKRIEAELTQRAKVSDEQLTCAQAAVSKAEAELGAAVAAKEQALGRCERARNHADLVDREKRATTDLAEMDKLLLEERRIEGEFVEWETLSAWVPRMLDSLESHQLAAKADAKADAKLIEADQIDIVSMTARLSKLGEIVGQAEKQRDKGRHALQKADENGRASVELLKALQRVTASALRLAELGDERAVRVAAAQNNGEILRLEGELAALSEKSSEAMGRRVQLEAAVRELSRQIDEREAAGAEGTCSRCGQPIDASHIEREIADLRAGLTAALANVKAALAEEGRAREEQTVVSEEMNAVKELLQKQMRLIDRLEPLRSALEDSQRELAERVASAPDPVKPLALMAPEPAIRFVEELQVARDNARTALDGGEHGFNAGKNELDAVRIAVDQMRVRLAGLEKEISGLQHEASLRRDRAQMLIFEAPIGFRASVDARDTAAVEKHRRRLADLQGVDQEHDRLQMARSEIEKLNANLLQLRDQIGMVLQADRILPREAETLLNAAASAVEALESERDQRRRDQDGLVAARDRRIELEGAYSEANRARILHARFGELVGRSGLQAALMDEATDTITRLANETLTRISGGSLRVVIERRPGMGEKEDIVIEATDLSFSDEPIDVAFLSGGQKFRVAVSLAAAIGQHVGGPGAVHALIIDEGFGSLDTQGRQDMVEELKQLAKIMDRVIVVSHQEDFQDRALFPTGFVITKEGGGTKVERFV